MRRALGIVAIAMIGSLCLPMAHATVPRVINGAPNPDWSDAAVALSMKYGNCTGALVLPNLVVTAAHCVAAEGSNPAEQPKDILVFPPGVNTDLVNPSGAKVVSMFYERAYNEETSPTGQDVAFLVTDASIGDPIIDRVATSLEAQAASTPGSTLFFAGYGMTTGGTGDGDVSPIPRGMSTTTSTPAYAGGSGAVTLNSDGYTGVCFGDSGGPWVTQRGNELLLISVTSSVSGIPCLPGIDGRNQDAAVVAGQPALLSQALAVAQANAQASGTTCLVVAGLKKACRGGNNWTYATCWEGSKASVQYYNGTAWEALDRLNAKRSSRCYTRAPYLMKLEYEQTEVGTSLIRIFQPQQSGVPRANDLQFTVTRA